MIWKAAKTYPDAPHEYMLRHEQPETFAFYEQRIQAGGVREKFTLRGRTATYRYYYEDGFKYWIIRNVLNRCPG